MPPTLHPHLKRGLAFDDFHFGPEDMIEERQAECRDPQQRAAKRRRVEAIASQYLQGKPPVILSAGLRGPFSHGWKNPWAKNSRPKRTSDKGSSTADLRSEASGSNTVEGTSTAKARHRKKKENCKGTKARIASPEASRTAEYDLEAREQDCSLNDIEVPPSTVPLPAEDDASGAAEFFSAITAKCVQHRSPLTNPFWLRRPGAERKVNMRLSTNGSADLSPTHSRSWNGHSQSSAGVELQLSLPKGPLRHQNSPSKVAVPEEWRSSASASMIISSPATPLDGRQQPRHVQRATKSPQHTLDHLNTPGADTTRVTPHSNMGGPCAQEVIAMETPIMQHQGSISATSHQSCNRIAQSADQQATSSTGSQIRPSRGDIQQSAGRLINMIPASDASSRQPRRSGRKVPQDLTIPEAPQHNLIASPALASSTGFVYRKVRETKRKCENAEKQKPRAVNFSSSPATKKGPVIAADQSPQNMSTIQEAGAPGNDTPKKDHGGAEVEPGQNLGEAGEEADGTTVEEPQQNSAMSTQAAMLLARMDFLQESTYHSTSSDTRRPWSQISQDTLGWILPEPSPAITPLSVFSPQLDKSLPNQSVLRGPPISTQDLFGAASPFAFSTVKKKPEASQRSSLRLALVGNTDEGKKANNATTRSPTPSADRVPLKAKNTTTSFWSFVTEKASQDSLVDRSRRSINDVELPQLDFSMSLDDLGPNGDIHFTDRFLRNLDDS